MQTTETASAEKLNAVNKRLKKGEGWIGYRYSTRDGNKLQSRYLYFAFYVNNRQKFFNSKSNDPEAVYRQLLEARRLKARGATTPSESARLTYEHLKAAYSGDRPAHDNAGWKSKVGRIDKFFRKMKANAITTDTLRAYINHRRKQGVQGPTIRRELVILRAMFNLAVKSKKLSHDAVPWFPMPEDSLPAGQYIAPEEFERIKRFLPDGSKRVAAKGGPKSKTNLLPLFSFLYATGCRLGAAKSVMWADINPDCTVVSISADRTKTKQPLKLPLAGPILEPIAKELRKRFRDNKPVFDTTNHRREWAKAVAKAGLGTWDKKTLKRTGARIHDCRASAAINLIDSGVNEGLVLKIGGWKTRKMLDRYNVTSIARLAEAMQKGGKHVHDRIEAAR